MDYLHSFMIFKKLEKQKPRCFHIIIRLSNVFANRCNITTFPESWVLLAVVNVVVVVVFDVAAAAQDCVPDWWPAEDGAEQEEAGGESGFSDGGGRKTPSSRSDRVTMVTGNTALWLAGCYHQTQFSRVDGSICVCLQVKCTSWQWWTRKRNTWPDWKMRLRWR